ncbi:MAG: hypothetical protein RLZZ628_534 [Bacteroidota bacterium]|jgi:hypothetical protein
MIKKWKADIRKHLQNGKLEIAAKALSPFIEKERPDLMEDWKTICAQIASTKRDAMLGQLNFEQKNIVMVKQMSTLLDFLKLLKEDESSDESNTDSLPTKQKYSKKRILNLLKKGKLDTAMKELLPFIEKERPDLIDDYTIIAGQIANTNWQVLSNQLSFEERSIATSKQIGTLLEFLELLTGEEGADTNDESNTPSPTTKQEYSKKHITNFLEKSNLKAAMKALLLLIKKKDLI